MGVSYNFGMGVERNYTEAVKWFRMAAEQGNPDAQAYMGHAYAYGQGVKKNSAEALRWFQAACAQGMEQACKSIRRHDF